MEHAELMSAYEAAKKKADLWDRYEAYCDRRNELHREFMSLSVNERRVFKWWAGWAEERRRRAQRVAAASATIGAGAGETPTEGAE